MLIAGVIRYLALATTAAAAFDCKQIEVNGSKYDLSSPDLVQKVSKKDSTPPSTTTIEFEYDVCNALKQSQCKEDAHLCGVETVEADGKSIVSRIMPIGLTKLDDKIAIDELSEDDQKGIVLHYSGNNWGDDHFLMADVYFRCSSDSKSSLEWDDTRLMLEIWSPQACAKNQSSKPKPPSGGDQEPGSSWGWFFFLLAMILSLVFIGHVLIQNYRRNGGNRADFSALVEIGRELPYLIRDFAQRVLALFRPNRGGYNAL